METLKLAGKKAIVTGANRSIGQAVAIGLAKLGAEIVISYRSDQSGAMFTVEQIQKIGGKAKAIHADFTNSVGINFFFSSAIESLGQVDILINNAGVYSRFNLLATEPEEFSRVLQINTIAPFYLLRLCAEKMIDHGIAGNIVNISSIAASMTFNRGAAYACSKAALNKLTQNSARELSEYNIRVNAVAPGVVASGMNAETAINNPELWQQRMTSIPLKRAGTPQDICQAVLFLATDDASWITGKIIEVDGGHVL